ncbi:MAG: DNA translocase FtsK [Eubacteriales bacterium]|nr:DNA translocase FtsK [Eubacteriales bacterium]
MAEKKTASKAEKMVSDAKKKTPAAASSTKSAPAKSTKKKTSAKTPKVKTEYENPIPASWVVAFLSMALFILFVVISVNPDGALLKVVKSVVLGLIGPAGFYFSIPAFLYLFVIHTFSRKTAVQMRSICVLCFVFLSGAIYHLAVWNQVADQGFDMIVQLYQSGVTGNSGGVLCGSFALGLRWACGKPLAFLITGLGAVLTLLGSMQITIPSIIRAIANRPRDDWEEEEEDDDYIEPAAIVVNHIANRQIEHKRQRRQQTEQSRATSVAPDILPEPAPIQRQARKSAPKPSQQPVQSTSQQPQSDAVKQVPGKGAAFMDRIDGEIGAPLAGTSEFVREDIPSVFEEPVAPPVPVRVEAEEPEIPARMPELEREQPIPPAPKLERTSKSAAKAPEEDKAGKVSAKDTAESAQQVAAEIAQAQAVQKPDYCFPPIDLLNRPSRGSADGTEEMRENSRRLNETLASFNIDAHIINVTRGPSVTRYEVELDKGVRLNKLTGCADDIALSLGASGVRIAAVTGKISVVGIEVPNRSVTTVSLREVIDSGEFAKAKSKSSIALGKSIDGNCVVGNIAKMPHLLIAGTTGSGKSVCMNSIIISLLYKAGPEDVKLIMVDPKMVELGIYNGIPHLLIPVVTDPKKAAGSLQWAVTEMLRRYKMMSDLGVRDLESYNSIVTAEEDGQKLPQVVIIIDELADLMMVAAKEVEDSICRIAQMGRAAGMHLIIATQRPSANVITGLMKANIPSRIAFSVASAMESRIILDTMGAEKLVGKGDMLYAPIGSGKPLRVQGCFVTDGEVEAVAEYVKENYVADYNQQVLEEIEKKAQQTGKKPASVSDPDPSDEELDGDEMLPAAVDVILETGQASVSMLQRRLKLGYARAARIVDEMEEKGIVGPFQGSKPRAILITKEQWQSMKGGQNDQMDFGGLDDYGAVPEEID